MITKSTLHRQICGLLIQSCNAHKWKICNGAAETEIIFKKYIIFFWNCQIFEGKFCFACVIPNT